MDFSKLFNQKPNIDLTVHYRINWTGAYLDCIGQPTVTSVLRDIGIHVEGHRNYTRTVCVYSDEMQQFYCVPLNFAKGRHGDWTDYIDGCVAILAQNHVNLEHGVNMVIHNDLPSGLGLGSSAAFLMAVLWAIIDAQDWEVSADQLILWAYQVETEYLHIPCGFMDFKAEMHMEGLYLTDNTDFDLLRDELLNKQELLSERKEIPLLILYDSDNRHRHDCDTDFNRTIKDLNELNTLCKYGIPDQFNECHKYITVEENLNNAAKNLCSTDIPYERFMSQLGILLDYSERNLSTIVPNTTEIVIPEVPGILGYKRVGSGRKGCIVVLYNPDEFNNIIKELRYANAGTVVIKPVFA